jgi:hypothetical protein
MSNLELLAVLFLFTIAAFVAWVLLDRMGLWRTLPGVRRRSSMGNQGRPSDEP